MPAPFANLEEVQKQQL